MSLCQAGKSAQYVTDTLIKITAGSKLDPDKTYGVKGFETKVEICKSRRAPAGRSVTLIYDQTNGFRNELSMLEYIKANGMLKGNGMAYYIDGMDTVKFKASTFTEKYKENEEFRNYVDATAKALLQASIKESNNIVVQTTPDEYVEEEGVIDIE